MKYVKLDEFDVGDMCLTMRTYIDAVDFRPDCIVGILEGGYIPARYLAKLLSISDMYTMTIKKYDNDGNKIVEEAELLVEPITQDLNNRRVLIVDDVCETGESLNLAVKEVKKYTSTVMACVLVAKDNFADIKIGGGMFCPFAKTFKVGTWVRFYWEHGY